MSLSSLLFSHLVRHKWENHAGMPALVFGTVMYKYYSFAAFLLFFYQRSSCVQY